MQLERTLKDVQCSARSKLNSVVDYFPRDQRCYRVGRIGNVGSTGNLGQTSARSIQEPCYVVLQRCELSLKKFPNLFVGVSLCCGKHG